jgi:hypothetical protein
MPMRLAHSGQGETPTPKRLSIRTAAAGAAAAGAAAAGAAAAQEHESAW